MSQSGKKLSLLESDYEVIKDERDELNKIIRFESEEYDKVSKEVRSEFYKIIRQKPSEFDSIIEQERQQFEKIRRRERNEFDKVLQMEREEFDRISHQEREEYDEAVAVIDKKNQTINKKLYNTDVQIERYNALLNMVEDETKKRVQTMETDSREFSHQTEYQYSRPISVGQLQQRERDITSRT